METINKNRKKLIAIIKTIILCGSQNIPLRGHRDDGDLQKGMSFAEGNFRALLKFRIDAGDDILADHISSCGKNASYISKTTQNELIQCCGALITDTIVNKIKKARLFTIIADETTDSSITEQLSICIRYFDVDQNEIREDFLKFVEVVDLTGENIAQHILHELEISNLDISLCRCQAYDGGANMSGKIKGVQACISKAQPLAFFSHCASHRLNLAICRACTVPNIRNAVGVISSVATFFRESSGRIHRLKEEMEACLSKEKQNVLKKMCETRWIERHEAVLIFADVLPCVVLLLEKMSTEGDKTGASAFSLPNAVILSDFIVSLEVLADIFELTLPLARSLQATEIDVLSATKLVEATLGNLQSQRNTSVDSFKRLWTKIEKLAAEMQTEIKVRRVNIRQTNRPNIPAQSAEEYYRLSVYIPFIDYLINELSSRFPPQLCRIGQLLKLLVNELSDEDLEDILQSAELHKNDLPCFEALRGELQIWQQINLSSSEILKSPADAFKKAKLLPNIQTICQLLCTLPVVEVFSRKHKRKLTLAYL
nr:unnamed protein product [Callosobruchus analis]